MVCIEGFDAILCFERNHSLAHLFGLQNRRIECLIKFLRIKWFYEIPQRSCFIPLRSVLNRGCKKNDRTINSSSSDILCKCRSHFLADTKGLEIVGVGFRADLAGNKLTLKLGFSHDIIYIVPEGIKLTVTDGYKISIEGYDKQLVGAVASTIRAFRKPEPYKGKGVRYSDEQVTIKPGKKNA